VTGGEVSEKIKRERKVAAKSSRVEKNPDQKN
jgi:hypothetical protein